MQQQQQWMQVSGLAVVQAMKVVVEAVAAAVLLLVLCMSQWLYTFGAPYALLCYIPLKCVRRAKSVEPP